MSPRKKPKAASQAAKDSSPRPWRWLIVAALTLTATIALIWGIVRLGEQARRGVAMRDRYTVRFADIACEPPPGLDRIKFLAEVRYQSNFPEQFQSLDADLAGKLTAAFIAHPWVLDVERVAVNPKGVVEVTLKYRQPVLAVRTAEGLRIVDGSGMLLPLAADAGKLPELVSPVAVPKVAAGHVWPDATVKRAVELVDAHQPSKLERTTIGWRLTMADGKVLMLER